MHPSYLFEIGPLKVYPYGIFIAAGILCCIVAFYMLSKKKGMPQQVQDFVFFVVIGALVGGFACASIFQSFYDWLAGKPFKLFSGGITVMGGLIGGAGVFLLLYFVVGKYVFKGINKDLHKKHFNNLFRIAPICIVIAQGFGRLGCLMGGCCHGAYLGSDYVFGGIWMQGTVNNIKTWGYFVPTQLYEALFLFILGAIMTILLFKRCNITMSIYLIAYGVWRFCIEYLRTDYRGGLPGLTPSQWTSFVFIGAGIVLLVIYWFKKWQFFFKEESVSKIEQEIKD